MSDKNIDGIETQRKLAGKYNDITVKTLAIESMQEGIEEAIEDLIAIYKENGDKKTKPEVKLNVEVYVDAEKAKSEEETKIEKSNIRLSKMEQAKEELSVLDVYRPNNLYDLADDLVGVVKWGFS